MGQRQGQGQPAAKLAGVTAEIKWVILPCWFDRVSNGVEYWRGVEVEVVKRTNQGGDRAWKVTLVEKELHAVDLEPFLRPGRLSETENAKIDFYAAVYNVVYQSCSDHAMHNFLSDGNTNTASKWPIKWPHLEPRYLAERGGCIAGTHLGGIARKIAADAVYYVFETGGTLRTPEQVRTLNTIVDGIADDRMERTVP